MLLAQRGLIENPGKHRCRDRAGTAAAKLIKEGAVRGSAAGTGRVFLSKLGRWQ